MPLTLEVIGRKAAQMGSGARKVFQGGGTIGRLHDNDWVFPDQYISGRHAKISLVGGRYLIEDTSTNGVFMNSPQNRIPRGQPQPLHDGDTVFIDDYEVRVRLEADTAAAEPGGAPIGGPRHPRAAREPYISQDPFFGGERQVAADEIDPMKLLGLEDPPARRPGPSAAALAGNSPLSQHYKPPAPAAAPSLLTQPLEFPSDAVASELIPDDYDPLAEDDSMGPFRPPAHLAPPSAPSQPPGPQRSAGRSALHARPAPSSRSQVARGGPAARGGSNAPASKQAQPAVHTTAPFPMPPSHPPSGSDERRSARAGSRSSDLDFAALLAGAGLDAARVSPELAEQFGQIMRVVVAGLMDVLQARGKIKDEFRMRLTSFKQRDNNPLKFSANVDDALHNILVKRNTAYLGPVEAFEDAFQDVRNHQMAMLAGMRVAYDGMLAEFDPQRLQKDFDEQMKAKSFLSGPAKQKYWELYCGRFRDMVKDADTCFRHLFGEEFAKAYEEQLARLKTLKRPERQ